MVKTKKGRNLTAEQQAEIKQAFEVFDADGSGAIDADELKKAMEALGFQPSIDEIKGMIAEVSDDGDEEVSYPEFEEMMTKLILGPAEEDAGKDTKKKKKKKKELSETQKVEITQAFEAFDTDGSGNIDADELERAMKVLGLSASREEVEKMIADVDKSGDGEVGLPEFIEMMTTLILGKDEDDAEDDATQSRGTGSRSAKSRAKKEESKKPKPRRTAEEDDNPGEKLLKLAEEGNLDRAKDLVKRWENSQMPGRPLNVEDQNGRTSLVRAVRKANVEFVKFLLTQNSIDIEKPDHDHYNALHHAVLLDCQAMSSGVESATNDTGAPSGTYGAEIAGMLARAGANLGARDEEGYTALMLASRFGASDVAQVLLELGANPQERCPHGLTALEHASKGRDAEGRNRAAELLMEWGLEPSPDKPEETSNNGLQAKPSMETDIPAKEMVEDLEGRCVQFEQDLTKELAALSATLLPEKRMLQREKMQESVCEEADTLLKELERDSRYRVRVVGRLTDDTEDEAAENFALERGNTTLDEPGPELSPNPKLFSGYSGYPNAGGNGTGSTSSRRGSNSTNSPRGVTGSRKMGGWDNLGGSRQSGSRNSLGSMTSMTMSAKLRSR